MVIAFDLDDTLYEEMSFVRSGFRAVSAYLSDVYSVPTTESFDLMMKSLERNGRGHIFDDVLSHFGAYSKKNIRRCISVYRQHFPDINLYPEADECLHRFENYPLYIVTDGNILVQRNKLIALGLYDRVRFCFLTHCYGKKNAKPSPYCLFLICKRENVRPEEVFYIGDNPEKDFVGIKRAGFKTIRILKGQYKDIVKSEEYEAEYIFNSLSELDFSQFKTLNKKINHSIREERQ
jgi:putative hydrolase of the HAD superfamily